MITVPDSETPQPTLKAYTLPSLKELGAGARSGIGGGLQSGALACPLLALFTYPWWSMISASEPVGRLAECALALGLVLIPACFIGAVLCLPMGFFTGVLTYFIITPWIPAGRWPEMRNTTRDGMRTGAVMGAAISGIVLGLLRLLPHLPILLREVDLQRLLLLVPVGLMAGGFGYPLWKIVLPAWRERES